MKLKKLSFPLVVALVLTATSCSSGSTTSKENSKEKEVAAQPRTKNAAIAPKRSLSQNPNNGVLSKDKPKESSQIQKSNTTVGVSIKSTGTPVVVPSDFCKLISIDCASLDFAQVEVKSPTSFVATAVIPNASIKLPAGDGFAFEVVKTTVKVVADGAASNFSVSADLKLNLKGSILPLTLTGTFIPQEATIAVELTNSNVGLKNAMGIPGFDINSITGKTTFVGGVPKGIGFSVSGTVPAFLKEMGINPNTPFTAAFEVGVGLTLGMSFGSQAEGSANIFNLKNILSARYLAFSYSSLGSSIAGVDYPKGFAVSFDGKFGQTSVVVDGNVSFAPFEYNIAFEIGAFTLGGFEFEESQGQFVRDSSGLNVKFSGGLKGYGITARMNGTFDPMGGIELNGEGGFVPAGVNLGSLKFRMVAKSSGVEFLGTGTNKFGIITGTETVGFKSFPGRKIGYTLGIGGGLQIPGVPSYGSVEGSLLVTNCPNQTCATPSAAPTATLSGSSSFYGSPRQSFSVAVDPNNWGFRKELSFNYDKNMSYSSNGFSIGARAYGSGSVVISNTGISFGKGSINASAGFSTPAVNMPAVTVPRTETRLPKVVCGGPWYNWSCHTEYYTSVAGGQTITPAYTIPGARVNLSAGVGVDGRGFYIDVAGGSGASGNRLYFS
jgi:hypothetical protein